MRARAFLTPDLPCGDVLVKQCSECFKQRKSTKIHPTTGTDCVVVFQHEILILYACIRLGLSTKQTLKTSPAEFKPIVCVTIFASPGVTEKILRMRKASWHVESGLPAAQLRRKSPAQLNLQGSFSPHAKGSCGAWQL